VPVGEPATPRLRASLLTLAVGLLAGAVAAQDPIPISDYSHSLDIYAFSQDDDDGRGGNPLQAEGFDYTSLRLDLTHPLDKRRTLRGEAVIAFIRNDPALPVPPTVINATTTSASGNLTTLDALLGADLSPEGSGWTYSPGLFYHHQIDYIGTGFDFAVQRDLFDGDTQLGFSYVLRYDFLELKWWDGTDHGSANRMANNFLFNWDQHLSPSVKTSLAAQYTRQDGFLSDQYNFVAIFTPAGVPILYDDERLPDTRNRGQLNARLRWSPRLDTSVGLDLSYYFDDWDIETVSGTVSFESVFRKLRVRVWYRLAVQDETKYFARMPTSPSQLQTQDSDLGSFTLHAPGMTVSYPLGRWLEKDSVLRFTVWGFSRDDGVDGLGAKIGVQLSW